MAEREVIVVGGGAIGLSVAEALAARDCAVTVLESGRCGEGASAGNAGWVTPSLSIPIPGPGVIGTSLKWLIDPSGPLWIRPTLSSAMLRFLAVFVASCRRPAYRRALRVLQELAGQAGGAFERIASRGVIFECHDEPLLYPTFERAELSHLLHVAGDLRAAGARETLEQLTPAELAELEPALDRTRMLGGLIAGGERRVRPESLTAGLHKALTDRGVPVIEQQRVERLIRDGDTWRVGERRAGTVVLACGVESRQLLAPLGLRLNVLGAKGYSRTYPVDPSGPARAVYLETPKVSVSPFDQGVRISGTLELGARTLELSSRRLHAITTATARAFPGWRMAGPPSDWAGMRSLSPDGLPYVGPVPGHDGLYLATAHATLGITLAPLTGELLARRILEGEHDPLMNQTDPGRGMRAP
jgi:D-amino-acid dehydrogenase